MSEPILTAEAREAVRSYMLSLLAIPSALVALLTFFLGYFAKEVAYQQAYNKAFADAQGRIMQYVEDAAKAGKSADTASKLLADALTASRQVQAQLEGAKAISDARAVSESVAQALLRSPDFSRRFRAVRLDALNETVTPIDKGPAALVLDSHSLTVEDERSVLVLLQVTAKATLPGDLSISVSLDDSLIATASMTVQQANSYATIPILAAKALNAGAHTISVRAVVNSGRLLITRRSLAVVG